MTKSGNVVCITSGHHRDTVRARRDRLIEEHLGLVDGIARAVARRLPPYFDIEDLVGAGNIALLSAATRYRPGDHGGAPFSAYARQRIRGAMLDSIRKIWCEGDGEHRFRPLWAELPDDGRVLASTRPTHNETIDALRMRRKLNEAISWLPLPQQRVLKAYYAMREPTMAEVGRDLGVSPRRAGELHALAIEGVRARFRLMRAA